MTRDAVQPLPTDNELETSRCRLCYPQFDNVPRLQSAFSSPSFREQVPLARLSSAEQVNQWSQGCQYRWALAFWTHPDCWCQDCAPEASQRAIRFAFEELATNRGSPGAGTWKQPSQRVLTKLGMDYTGDNPEGHTVQRSSMPMVEFEITRAAGKQSNPFPGRAAT